MIVTVTPNPSLDLTLEIDALLRGEVVRASRSQVDPGGKGVNVARVLARNGHPTHAIVPTGGPDGRLLRDLLGREAIDHTHVEVEAPTRTNVTIAEPDGTVTKINAAGPHLAPAEIDRLIAAVSAAATGADWLVCSGRLTPGAPVDTYTRIISAGRSVGARVALDTSGGALTAGLPARPHVVKPNAEELGEATGITIATLGDVERGARVLIERGAGEVLVSLGASGAVLVRPDLSIHGEAKGEPVRSTVGAGDSLLAGYIAGGAGPAGLATGLSWAAAACSLPGSTMPGPSDVISIDVVLHPSLDVDRKIGG